MSRAFEKSCAPSVAAIGSYNFVDDCEIPQPPSPIVTPLDIPIPIPPVDQGCYPLNVTGSFHGPDDPETPVDGSVGVSVTYPSGDPCEPDIQLDIFVPCFVSFTTAHADVNFDPLLTSTTANIAATNNSCDLGLSLSIGIPCPTDIVGSGGRVKFSPGTSGSLGVQASKVPDSCDLALSFDLELPCPTVVTAKATVNQPLGSSSSNGIACNAAIPDSRLPKLAFAITSSEGSSSGAGCQTNIKLNLDIPCPVVWRQPVLKTKYIPEYRQTVTGTFGVNTTSSSCALDCNPELVLELQTGCPLNITSGTDSSNDNITYGASNRYEWAITPTAGLAVTYKRDSSSNIDTCAPNLDISLDLPCPIQIRIGVQGSSSDDANVTFVDNNFFKGSLSVTSTPVRQWAFGQPTAQIVLEYGKNDRGNATPCVPILDLALNLPCPTGGAHSSLSFDPAFTGRSLFLYEQDSLVLKDRNQQYKDKYGTEDASLHPYYDQLPTGTIVVNQNLGYFATPGKEDFAKYAAGRVTKSEFDESCQLDLQMSLYIPCGKRSPKVEFFDIADFGNALADPLPSTEYRAEAIQDWTDGPDAGDCAFDETLKLYVNPNGSGGGDFGMIKARAGTTPPYRYAAWGAVMDINGVWSAVSSKLYEPVYNKEEQGTGGQYVNPLNVGDVISVKRAPGGADAYVGERSHYRGTF